MIVDAHAHLGLDEIFDEDFTAEELLAAQKQCGIDITLVQPATRHDLPGVMRQHDAIAALAEQYPGRFYGIANPNPHLPEVEYEAEVRRCVEKMGFVGIKIHPLGHAVNPLGRHGRRVFPLAAALGVPVMVHTGLGMPWASPALLEPALAEHANLRIVLAHAGGTIFAADAGLLARRYPNVYLECSWAMVHQVRRWIQELGARRVMFGSDHAENAAPELAKFRATGLPAEALDWALGRTAARVFNLPLSETCGT
jgi:predicted TIM-barrel fold metal-dependent hydrolase